MHPKVSVCIITYNQENFIAQAVESVLMQETDFDCEIIIGDDHSTDRTREILIELQKSHPDRINLILQPANIGGILNLISVFNCARGEYVAFLEGDDYWTSPHKLQRQVVYMDAHPDCYLCFHGFKMIFENGSDLPAQVIKPLPNVPNKVDGFESMQSSTFLCRRNGLLPDWFHELRASGEWPLITWTQMQGRKFGSLEGEPMSVCRKQLGGVSTMRPTVARGLDKLHDYYLVTEQLSHEQRKWVFYSPLHLIHQYLCRAYIATDDFPKARYHFLRYVYYNQTYTREELSTIFKLALRSYLLGVYRYFRRSSTER